MEALRAGDILLTLGSEKKSAAIAQFSKGQYSHAALCLNQSVIFESDGGLIGDKLLQNLGSAIIDTKRVFLSGIPGNPVQCAVYRHPDIDTVSSVRFEEAMGQEMSESYGKDYSEKYRLVPLAQCGPVMKRLLDAYFRFEHRSKYADSISGPFCSELVAKFYERLQLPLFSEAKRPDQISPNDLANSALERRDDVVLRSNELTELWSPDMNNKLHLWSEGNPLAELFHYQHGVRRNITLVNEWGNRQRRNTRDALDAIIKQAEEPVLAVSDHLAQVGTCVGLINDGIIRRASRLARRSLEIAAELLEIAQNPEQDLERLFVAMQRAQAARCSLLRCETLFNATLVKKTRRGVKIWTRWRNERRHRKLIKRTRALTTAYSGEALRLELAALRNILSPRSEAAQDERTKRQC
jgi:Orthopoxvirus protein of unknown function (DUF830).